MQYAAETSFKPSEQGDCHISSNGNELFRSAFKPWPPVRYPILEQTTDDDRMGSAASRAVSPLMSDAADVALAADGDRQAFERLYRTHANRVYSLCARMSGSRTKGEELTQDVLVRTWEKLPQFRGESAFSTWLHRLAVNVVLNARKVDGKHAARMDEGSTDEERWNEVAGAPLQAPSTGASSSASNKTGHSGAYRGCKL